MKEVRVSRFISATILFCAMRLNKERALAGDELQFLRSLKLGGKCFVCHQNEIGVWKMNSGLGCA